MIEFEGVRLMKCITHDCPNCSDQGVGRTICVEPDDDGWICEPCWNFLTTGRGRVNQICTNSKKVSEPTVVADESEQMGMYVRDISENDTHCGVAGGW